MRRDANSTHNCENQCIEKEGVEVCTALTNWPDETNEMLHDFCLLAVLNMIVNWKCCSEKSSWRQALVSSEKEKLPKLYEELSKNAGGCV
jgi:hypothetical protein